MWPIVLLWVIPKYVYPDSVIYQGRPVIPKDIVGKINRKAVITPNVFDTQSQPLRLFKNMNDAIDFYKNHSSTSDINIITTWIKNHAEPSLLPKILISAQVLP